MTMYIGIVRLLCLFLFASSYWVVGRQSVLFRNLLQDADQDKPLMAEGTTILNIADDSGQVQQDNWDRMLKFDPEKKVLHVNSSILVGLGSSPAAMKIILYASERTTKPSSCSEELIFSSSDFFLQHSSLYVQTNSDGTVQKNESINFLHVYSGYYCLHIIPCNFFRPPMVCFEQLQGRTWSPVLNYWSEDGLKKPAVDQWNVTVSVQSESNSLIMRFRPMNVAFMLYDIELRQVGQEDGEDCHMQKSIMKKEYKLRNTEIQEVTFVNLKPGNYCFLIIPNDSRCNSENAFWNPQADCVLFTSTYELLGNYAMAKYQNDATQPTVETEINETIFIITGIVFGVAVIIFLLVVACSRYRRTNRETTEDGRGVGKEWGESIPCRLLSLPVKQVLLVYSRGPAPFQDLMQQFRSFLESACHCQVHDCMAEDQVEFVNPDPSAWLMEKISCTNMKILVVSTEDGFMRQIYRNTNHELIYRDIHCFDNLFLRSIRAIQEEIDENEKYKRVLMIRFDDFTSENHLLLYINPYCRFILPQHLQELFLNIHEETNNNEDIWAAYSSERRQLQDKIDAMKNFAENNPHYVKDLFIVEPD